MSRYTNLICVTSRILTLARSGLINRARELFDEMPERDTVTWNVLLTGYAQLGLAREALHLFSDMRAYGPGPDDYTLTASLSASADDRDLNSGRKIHSLLVSSGFESSLPVCNSLIDMYGKCSQALSARDVFDRMGHRNVVSWCSLLFAYSRLGDFNSAHQSFHLMPVKETVAWNVLISGYSQLGKIEPCLALFREMQHSSFKPDLWTLSSLMNVCTDHGSPFYGCLIHGFITRSGWNSNIVVSNSVLSFYAAFGSVINALMIFNSMEVQTLVSWNAMIDAYMKAGAVQEALSMFLSAPEKNVVSWTAMIGGHARLGHGEEALSLFISMTRSCICGDEFSFGSVLHACASLTVLVHGKMVHGSAICNGFASYLYVANGLIDMYAKCGDVISSNKVFVRMQNRDLVSWNAMLIGFALHGWASDAFSVYGNMMAVGFVPDKVTFIGLLMACNHAGLVEQGRQVFEMMHSVHRVHPDGDHLTCVIDMFGRAGHLHAAEILLKDSMMLMGQKNTNYWEALLGACSVHGDLGIGRCVGEELVAMEPHKDVGYVVLSNMYSASGRWEDAERMRRAMVEQGVRKMPGCSWIEISHMVMVFVTGNQSLCCMNHVCKMLGFLDSEMRNPCSVEISR